MERHYIQQNIINELQKSESLSFSKLNTTGVSNDHFSFHIKQLVKDGLVEKIDDGYRLTTKGLELAGRMDVNTSSIIRQPKVSISLGIFKNNDSEVVVMKRKRAPSLHKYVWIDRKLRFGNSLKEEIDSLLLEEVGLSSSSYIFMGATHVIRKEEDEVEIDVIVLNFKIQDPTGELKSESRDGENLWMNVEDIQSIDTSEKLSGFDERLVAYLQDRIILQELIS